MLARALTRQSSLIIALEPAEEAVAVHLAQIEEQSVKLSVRRFNIRLEPFKWKLDLFFRIEYFLDQALAQVNISFDMVQGQLWSDFRLLDSLIVLDRR